MKLFSWFEGKHFDHIYLWILYVHAMAHIWRSEDNLRSLVLILHNVGSRDRILIAMLGKKCLKPHNYPPVLDLKFYFRPKQWFYLRFKALCCMIIILFFLCVHSCAWIHVVYSCVCAGALAPVWTFGGQRLEPDTVLYTCLPCSLESKSFSEPGTQHFG